MFGAVNFDYGQRQKAALKEMPRRLEPMVPAPQREDFKTQGQASPCALTSFLCFESLGLRSAGPQDGGLVEKRDLRTRQG
jgi:hypothetical protein